MFCEIPYPIICTDNFVKTINFYEDHFQFAPMSEQPGYALLKRQGWPSTYIAIIDATHEAIPENYRRPVAGMILSLPAHNVEEAYQELYWEGLDIISEPNDTVCGRRHFLIEDPNGILIDIAENIPVTEAGHKTDEIVFAN